MAAPLTIAAIAAECTRLGATVKIWPNAAKIGRPGTLNVHGVTVHITAGDLGSRTAQQYIADIIDMAQVTDDPVRANAVAAPDGTLWLTAQGRSNHALYYSQKAMQACLDATFPDSGSVDWRGGLERWSDYTVGIEMIAGSGAKVTTAQRRAALIWAAAICRLYGWTGGEIHGHGEVSQDRSPLPSGDPGIDMGAFRRDAKKIIQQGASTPITTNPGIPSTPTQEDDMPLTDADVQKVADAVNKNRMAGPRDLRAKDSDLTWQVVSMIESTQAYAVMAYKQGLANAAAINAVAAKAGISQADITAAVAAAVTANYDATLVPKEA